MRPVCLSLQRGPADAPGLCPKCVTAITALDRLGVDYQFSTRLYCRGDIDSTGVLHGSLYCVGGMDPLFGDANMRAFVRALREKASVVSRATCWPTSQ